MKKITKKGFGGLFWALLLAAELAAAADVAAVFLWQPLPRLPWAIGAGLLFLLLALLPVSRRRLREDVLGLLFLLLLLGLLLGAFLMLYPPRAAYARTDAAGKAFFAGHRVLVVVPHAGDELSLAGGLTDEYLRGGSEVTLLFTTNGDLDGSGEARIREALAAAGRIGIQAERVIFLGYGEGWQGGVHLYNSKGETLVSSAGRSETAATSEHPAFREGRSYTRAHFLEDMGAVLAELRPDVILAAAYEEQPDHRAASLFFEEALAGLLKQDPSYRPLVLKGLCDPTADSAAQDFYAPNLLAAQNPGESDVLTPQRVLLWSERVRIPLAPEALSRSLLSSSLFLQLREYAAQGSAAPAEGFINGDRVFWLRRTDSLCLRAKIEVSSGDASRLNDFKLLDSEDLYSAALPTAGTWVPDGGDGEREIRVTLAEPAALTELRLYDNPSAADDVRGALLILDNGQKLEIGPLEKNGSATVVPLDGQTVSGFVLRLTDTRGSRAGLTELEAFAGEAETGLDFVKLMDDEGNFVYDYYIDTRGRQSFSLYTSGKAAEQVYNKVRCEGEHCSAIFRAGKLDVLCPKGRSCVITVTSADGRYSDSVTISNPGRFYRSTAPQFERFLLRAWREELPKTNSFCLLRELCRLVGR